MYFVTAIIIVWLIGIVAIILESNKILKKNLEKHDKMRLAGLAFISFSIISSFPIISLVLLLLK